MPRAEGLVESLNRQGMGTMFQSQGANKRALSLNLKTEVGRDIFRRLAASAARLGGSEPAPPVDQPGSARG